jgi:hypothetical protein
VWIFERKSCTLQRRGYGHHDTVIDDVKGAIKACRQHMIKVSPGLAVLSMSVNLRQVALHDKCQRCSPTRCRERVSNELKAKIGRVEIRGGADQTCQGPMRLCCLPDIPLMLAGLSGVITDLRRFDTTICALLGNHSKLSLNKERPGLA